MKRSAVSTENNHGGVHSPKLGSLFVEGGCADTRLPTNLGRWKVCFYPLGCSHDLAIAEFGFVHIKLVSQKILILILLVLRGNYLSASNAIGRR